MKKLAAVIGVMVFALVTSLSCTAGEITIVGTGSGSSILAAVGEAYADSHPGVKVLVPKSIGSGGGIKAVGTDSNVLGRVAREIKDKEKPFGLTYLPYAKNPIVFFVNKSIGVKNLTTGQVCDIYSGKVTNWKDVGGKDAKIRVVRREDGDSSLSVLLKTFPGFRDITITAKSKTTYSDPDTCELVEKKAGAIAFGTYANALDVDVNILDIGGKAPTDKEYAYVGILALIFKEKNNVDEIARFISFVTSPDAHTAIRRAGGSPI